MEQRARPSNLDNNFSPQTVQMCDGKYVSTSFVYNTVAYQNQANFIYQNQQTMNTYYSTIGSQKKFQFGSHQDRLAALIGQYNQRPCTNN
jgi:hypothetical protein